MKLIFLLSLLLSNLAFANIICHVQTEMGPAVVSIGQDAVTVSGAALSKPATFMNPDAQWDGHETELITAHGLSISYQNWFGCIHNAQITTNFRDSVDFIESVKVNQCSGGSTPDKICHVPTH